jgi:hypothetical protein
MVSLANNQAQKGDASNTSQTTVQNEVLRTASQDLSTLVPVDMREDTRKAFKDLSKGLQSIKPREIDAVLKGVEATSAGLDTNRDGRLGSKEIHTEVVGQVRQAFAYSSLNSGTLENPKFPFAVDLMLHNLKHQQSFLVPILKEQRVFNDVLGAYKEALKAFDTVFPKGFNREEVVRSLDGLDGSKKDGRLSGPELQAAVDSNSKQAEAAMKHLTKALTHATKGAEGICEYILARPEIMQQMAGMDDTIQQRLEAGRDIARSYRQVLGADSPEEVLAATRKIKEAATAAMTEEPK